MIEYLTIFSVSVFGSWHCAGMCGAFCMMATKANRKASFLYHFGRLTTYIFLATISYYSFLPIRSILQNYNIYIFAAVTLVFITLMWAFFKTLDFTSVTPKYFKLAMKNSNEYLKSYFVGLVSTVLPCAWLYTFVAYSMTKTSLPQSILVMLIFWSGTIPALFLIQHFTFLGSKIKKLRWAGILVIALLAFFEMKEKINLVDQSSKNQNNLFCQPFGKSTEKTVP